MRPFNVVHSLTTKAQTCPRTKWNFSGSNCAHDAANNNIGDEGLEPRFAGWKTRALTIQPWLLLTLSFI